MYHRFYRNYLFLPVSQYKTTMDKNTNTTQRNPIHFMLSFAHMAAGCR